jgi:hypothetical protein
MRNIRISLRHTGVPGFRFGVSREYGEPGVRFGIARSYHQNIFFGRFFLAIRDKRSDPPTYKPKFMDLEFGREQLKYRRLWDAMTENERYLYVNYNPEHFRLEHFLKMIRPTH